MSYSIETQVRQVLANFVDVAFDAFRMDADLDSVYDMDSTELTALAMDIEKQFGVKANKSARDDWTTGNKVCAFVQAHMPRTLATELETALPTTV